MSRRWNREPTLKDRLRIWDLVRQNRSITEIAAILSLREVRVREVLRQERPKPPADD